MKKLKKYKKRAMTYFTPYNVIARLYLLTDLPMYVTALIVFSDN